MKINPYSDRARPSWHLDNGRFFPHDGGNLHDWPRPTWQRVAANAILFHLRGSGLLSVPTGFEDEDRDLVDLAENIISHAAENPEDTVKKDYEAIFWGREYFEADVISRTPKVPMCDLWLSDRYGTKDPIRLRMLRRLSAYTDDLYELGDMAGLTFRDGPSVDEEAGQRIGRSIVDLVSISKPRGFDPSIVTPANAAEAIRMHFRIIQGDADEMLEFFCCLPPGQAWVELAAFVSHCNVHRLELEYLKDFVENGAMQHGVDYSRLQDKFPHIKKVPPRPDRRVLEEAGKEE